MNRTTRGLARIACAVVLVAASPPVVRAIDSPGSPRFWVSATAGALIDQGLAAVAPDDPVAAGFHDVPPPSIRFVANESQATSAPWIDSNGWRFQRGIAKANYARLPAGSAPLAAAEAFAFGVDASLNPEAADVEPLGEMLRFLKAAARPRLPILANIGIVDDKSRGVGEILNLLTRRNLLYRVVAEPDPGLDLNVEVGTERFPRSAAEEPYEFVARLRAELGDDKRLVRIYGTNTLIAHLTGDAKSARLHLLSYARNGEQVPAQAVRIRVRGQYRPIQVAAFGGAPDAALTDVANPGDSTEFFLPAFRIIAIVDLER